MSDANKILTVSYGTFSCTLEGFDDPFGTMRGIAEYFRDLAAEDRYFGAEPPTPDVEMLQAIAEKDVKRRVEARIGETGIALRAETPVEDAELAEPPAQETAAEEPEVAVADDVAAEETAAPDKPEPADIEADDVPETAPLAFDDEYLMADEPEDVLTVDIDARPVPSDHAPESIAEKLRRIRAVVSRNIEPEPAAFPELDEDEPEDDATSPFAEPVIKRDRALSETLASITADLADEHEGLPEAPDEIEPDTEAPDDTVAETEEADASAEVADQSDDFADEDLANVFDDDIEDESLDDEMLADEPAEDRVEAIAEPDDDQALAEPAHADTPDEMRSDAETLAAGDDGEDYVLEDDLHIDAGGADGAEPDEDLGVASVVAEDTLTAEGDVSPGDDVDSGEDEGEKNLASVIADVMDRSRSETVADADGTDDAEPPAPRPADTLEPLSETNGNVGRLLQETDQKFADDEGVRRRRVISQMRAAVAATKADRFFSRILSPEEKAEAEQSPYRRDLNRVITAEVVDEPRADTPEAAPAHPETPDTAETAEPPAEPVSKPAPLVLVSSQRVDEAPADTRVISRPEPGSFAEFASEMGAEELPDLLEAAAAYSAFVEGQPHFSRPDIMKRVARVDPALSLSREAGLRSFGMLLRQGKIRKLQRGQFTITEDTRFNPGQRIAGE